MHDASTPDTNLDGKIEASIHHKVERLAQAHGLCDDDRESLEQDVTLHLLECRHGFDPTKATFATFACRCIDNYLVDVLRRRQGQHQRSGVRRLPAAGGDGRSATAFDFLEDTASARGFEQANLRMDLATVMASLPAHLAELCRLLQSHAPFAAARLMGVSKQSIYQDMQKLRQVFRAAGLGIYLEAAATSPQADDETIGDDAPSSPPASAAVQVATRPAPHRQQDPVADGTHPGRLRASSSCTAEHQHKGRAAAHRLLCLAQVYRQPGLTATEIADRIGVNRYSPSRRLPELRRDGLITMSKVRPCSVTGRMSTTWIPAEEARP